MTDTLRDSIYRASLAQLPAALDATAGVLAWRLQRSARVATVSRNALAVRTELAMRDSYAASLRLVGRR